MSLDRDGNLETETHRSRSWEDGGRSWSKAATLKEHQGWPATQKPGESHGTDPCAEPPEGNSPAHALVWDFWVPELGGNKSVWRLKKKKGIFFSSRLADLDNR